jgi:hypothetical protein
MPASPKLIAALTRHGLVGATEKAQLTTWKSEALTEIAANKGGSPISGSANGVAFTLGGTGSLTVSEWFTALDVALQWVEKGAIPTARTSARIS